MDVEVDVSCFIFVKGDIDQHSPAQLKAAMRRADELSIKNKNGSCYDGKRLSGGMIFSTALEETSSLRLLWGKLFAKHN
jgi:hypothetical protein